MDSLMKEQAILLFDAYNRALEEVYEDALEGVENESVLASPEFQIYLQNNVLNSMQPWFMQELEGLSEGTPEAFFDSILSLSDALDIFEIAAQKVDGDLPELFLLRLGAFGDEAASALLELAFAHDWVKPEGMNEMDFHDTLAVDIAAMRVLGLWKNSFAVTPVLDRFLALSEPNEFLADGVKSFVIAFEEDIVAELLTRLAEPADPELGGGYEYLLIFLTQIGMVLPSEEIFQILKDAFRKMKNKVIAVLCLGDYGDGRVVPLLKSYLDRHLHEVDQQFFYETLSVIKRLGGDISDVENPFRRNG